MASKLLLMYEEVKYIQTQIKILQNNKSSSTAAKISAFVLRLKALNARADSYGRSGNLYLVNFLENNYYFSDIAEEDLDYIVEYHAKKQGHTGLPAYTFKKIPLGIAIEY